MYLGSEPEWIKGAISSAISGLCRPCPWYPGLGTTLLGGPPDPLFSLVVRAAAANVNPRTRLSHMTEIPPFLGS
jgi:hypothetical protein